ncbi:MAG TPA: hypothetical protein V6C65_27885, partial [Allocoleopsis sp.]
MKIAFSPRMFPVTLLSFASIIYLLFGVSAAHGLMMASVLNVADCAAPDSVFNTGVPPCDLSKKKIKGVILLDHGTEFTGGDVASKAAFIAAIKTATTAARGSRAYPIWDLRNFEDSSGDPATGGVGNLTTSTVITSDVVPVFRFGYKGTEKRHTRMAALAGATLDLLLVDEGWTVYGTIGPNGGLCGYTIEQAYADTSKFPIADAVNQYSFRITLADAVEYRDRSSYIKADSTLATALGLVNVELSQYSLVSNVAKLYMIADGGTNLEPAYGAILDGLTWTATNLETGASFTVTSVATDSTNDVMTVTLDSTAWAALASG